MVHPLAGKPAPRDVLIDVEKLRRLYYDERPDPNDPQPRVAFGTSGHRGSSLHRAFNEAHILAITQAICEYRKAQGTTGPLYLGKDTHALADPAQETALEVLAANDVHVLWSRRATPMPVISHAILTYNRGLSRGFADGIVITPSHNPPEDGGIKCYGRSRPHPARRPGSWPARPRSRHCRRAALAPRRRRIHRCAVSPPQQRPPPLARRSA